MRTRGFLTVGFLLSLCLAGVRVIDPYPVQAVRSFYFDYLQRLSPREYASLPVRVVDIDEVSLAAIGQWPWPRSKLAELVVRLADDYGVSAIAFDVLFPEPDRLSASRVLADPTIMDLLAAPPTAAVLARLDNDQNFASAMDGRNVVLGFAEANTGKKPEAYDKSGFVEIGATPASALFELRSTTGIVPVLKDAAKGLGGINVSPLGESEIIRTVPMLWRSPAGILPSLSLEALRVALNENTTMLVGTPGLDSVVASIRVGDFAIPTTADGQLWLRYRHENPALYVSAGSVLAPGYDPELRAALEGNIVFIGSSAAGLLDIRATPLGESVPGVSIHAQILEQILTGDFLVRGDYQGGLEVIAFICVSAIVVSVMSISGPAVSMAAGAAAALLMLITSWGFFVDGTLFDATFPLFGGFSIFLLLSAYQFIVADREKRLIRRSFSHYVAPAVLQEIEKSGHRLELGGQMRAVTVMFCDMRDFTPLSETMTAPNLVSLLNNLFSILSECVLKENGTIDKYIGDSIMAFWNAPLEMADYRKKACSAALGIRDALKQFNQTAQLSGQRPLAVAIGLSSGPACVGNIGSLQRHSYSAIGDTVNVAARIETSCRRIGYDVVISDDTCAGVSDMATLYAGHVALKGKSDRTALHILIGNELIAKSMAFSKLRSCHEKLLAEIAEDGRISARSIERCKAEALGLDAGLMGFYDKLSDRLEDISWGRHASSSALPAAKVL